MNTPTQLRRIIEASGARMEEDEGSRDMRTFQAVAPIGMIWNEGCVCIRIDWARGSSAQAVAFNDSQFKSTSERIGYGFRPMTEDEKDMCSED